MDPLPSFSPKETQKVTQDRADPPLRAKDAATVSVFRKALDWMLLLPEWESAFTLSLSRLGINARRQGTVFRKTVLGLSIEIKRQLIRDSLRDGLPPPRTTELRTLAKHWRLDRITIDSSRKTPKRTQWKSISTQLILAIGSRYSSYKHCQSRLYEAYQAMALRKAKTICLRPAHLEDAQQEARLALLSAIDKIEPDQRFEPYARQWIERRVRNYLMQMETPVRVPINLLSRSLQQKTGTPSNRPSPSLPTFESHPIDCLSEHEILPQTSEHGTPSDCPAISALERDDLQNLANALLRLTAKQREILAHRFGLGIPESNPSQIAQAIGISRQQVYRREQRALSALEQLIEPLR